MFETNIRPCFALWQFSIAPKYCTVTRVGVNSIPELELLVNSNSNSGIGIGIGIEIGGIENGIGIENPGIGIGIGIENRNWFFAMATAALTN